MNVSDIATKDIVVVEKSAMIRHAIDVIKKSHVRDVVVVDIKSGSREPVGVLTDRDILLQVIDKNLDPDQTTVSDVMSSAAIVRREDSNILDILQTMEKERIRLLPLVDDKGSLTHVVSSDDILQLLAKQVALLGQIVEKRVL